LEDRELSFEKNARVRGFVDGFACGLGGWKHVNFCVGDLGEGYVEDENR
jgi:hypothetical protein